MTDDRGIREPALSPGARALGEPLPLYHSFGGAVIAGTLLVISVSILSYLLMFALRIGVMEPAGVVALGWGAAIWTIVTACIAYFLGGHMASYMTGARDRGWIHGLSVWALSIPLIAILGAFVAAGSALAFGLATVQVPARADGSVLFLPSMVQVTSGEAWTLFLTLAAGLIFAYLGGLAGGRAELMTARR